MRPLRDNALSLAFGVLFAAPTLAQRAGARFDVLITNARVVDGTGTPWYRGDIAISGDTIAAIGNLATAAAVSKVDASGLVAAPGFIDLLGQSEFNVLVDGRAASKVYQGVTTEVTGEGSSIAPLNDRLVAEAAAGSDESHRAHRRGRRTVSRPAGGPGRHRRAVAPGSSSGRHRSDALRARVDQHHRKRAARHAGFRSADDRRLAH